MANSYGVRRGKAGRTMRGWWHQQGSFDPRKAGIVAARMAAMAGSLREISDRLAPWRVVLLGAALFLLGSNVVVLATAGPGTEAVGAVSSTEASAATPLVLEPAPTTTPSTEAPLAPASTTTTQATPPPPPAPVPATTQPAAPPSSGPWSLEPYRGLGAWVDVYDWSVELTGGAPTVSLAQIDQMAQQGVQTLYIQTGHRRSPSDIMEHHRLTDLIDRAHSHGMYVVGWYLPMLLDLETDLRRMVDAATALPLDGYGVDIESIEVGDVAERNRRLLTLSTRLRAALGPAKAISAITPSAVHLQVVNPGFWPDFPWAQLAGAYDVFQPMAYWSVRRTEWRHGARYIAENIDRIRAATGQPELPIHPVGGIADGVSVADIVGMLDVSTARGVLGLSLYDWRTSNPDQWAALTPIRR